MSSCGKAKQEICMCVECQNQSACKHNNDCANQEDDDRDDDDARSSGSECESGDCSSESATDVDIEDDGVESASDYDDNAVCVPPPIWDDCTKEEENDNDTCPLYLPKHCDSNDENDATCNNRPPMTDLAQAPEAHEH